MHSRGFARRAILLLLFGTSLSACRKPKAEREDLAIRNFVAENSFARDFRKIYPQSIGFFTLFESEGGTTIWNSKVGLHGRYILRMKMKVTLGRSGVHVERETPPEFTLLEVASISKESDGGIRYRYRPDSQLVFDSIRWNLLVQAGGDLSSIGVTPSAEAPLPLFEENWNDF
jgi:hypothetical protein